MPRINDGKNKIIRDPVHGYVEVDDDLIRTVVDTPIFQRLLRIQQTNLSVLYPSATHTRFEHSIGVFFLGRLLFDTICKNTCFEDFGKKKKDFEEKYRNTFLLACLLHDVGHAPLSHTGEEFFNKDELLVKLGSLGVSLEIIKQPAEHELMSCVVALSAFDGVLSKYEVDNDLFCRIITGVEYEPLVKVEEKDFKNILIKILNSSFDVDKMDYIMRDSLSAGITTLTLDIYRIANSLAILSDNGIPRLAFKKVGFSVINNVINNRNYLYYWLYGHHKVQYHHNVLKRYIRELKKHFPEQIGKLFSIGAIVDDKLDVNFTFLKSVKQVDDYDLFSIMKSSCILNPKLQNYYEQIFERKHYSPMWKTKIEFDQKCKQSTQLKENLVTITNMADDPIHNIEPTVAHLLSNAGIDLKLGEFYIFNREFKLKFPDFEEKIYFLVPECNPPFKKYSELFSHEGVTPKSEIEKKMFFVFLQKRKKQHSENLLKTLENIGR